MRDDVSSNYNLIISNISRYSPTSNLTRVTVFLFRVFCSSWRISIIFRQPKLLKWTLISETRTCTGYTVLLGSELKRRVSQHHFSQPSSCLLVRTRTLLCSWWRTYWWEGVVVFEAGCGASRNLLTYYTVCLRQRIRTFYQPEIAVDDEALKW